MPGCCYHVRFSLVSMTPIVAADISTQNYSYFSERQCKVGSQGQGREGREKRGKRKDWERKERRAPTHQTTQTSDPHSWLILQLQAHV